MAARIGGIIAPQIVYLVGNREGYTVVPLFYNPLF